MKPDAVARLQRLLIETWPGGVRGPVWRDVLADLDSLIANATYEWLRDHEDRSPTVARFREQYRALARRTDTEARTTTQPDEPAALTRVAMIERLRQRGDRESLDIAERLERRSS